ncbi:hypothetical protein AQJ64_36850 [Streptomyces griseoruber]|uniref:Uncharacterized protein n=1 Tax=Streptomyces griseoruber TaxID=1943 RepID=A0A101SLW6_9ACTN|nr:hypothetical protein AQJ64_36850 [Streptomyces griseoruber]
MLGHLTAAGEDAENAAQRRAVRNGQPAPGDTTHQVAHSPDSPSSVIPTRIRVAEHPAQGEGEARRRR